MDKDFSFRQLVTYLRLQFKIISRPLFTGIKYIVTCESQGKISIYVLYTDKSINSQYIKKLKSRSEFLNADNVIIVTAFNQPNETVERLSKDGIDVRTLKSVRAELEKEVL